MSSNNASFDGLQENTTPPSTPMWPHGLQGQEQATLVPSYFQCQQSWWCAYCHYCSGESPQTDIGTFVSEEHCWNDICKLSLFCVQKTCRFRMITGISSKNYEKTCKTRVLTPLPSKPKKLVELLFCCAQSTKILAVSWFIQCPSI